LVVVWIPISGGLNLASKFMVAISAAVIIILLVLLGEGAKDF